MNKDRGALLDHLRQTAREARALTQTIGALSAETLSDQPGGLPSVLDLLWLLVLVDRDHFLASLENTGSGAVRLDRPDYERLQSEHTRSSDDPNTILRAIEHSRTQLVSTLEKEEDWTAIRVELGDEFETDLKGLAEVIVEHDRQLLSTLGHRFYETRFSSPLSER